MPRAVKPAWPLLNRSNSRCFGLVGAYAFETPTTNTTGVVSSTSEVIRDLSGYGNNGIGNPFGGACPQWIHVQRGWSLDWPASVVASWIDFGASPSLNFERTQPFSLVMDVNIPNAAVQMTILGNRNITTARGYGVQLFVGSLDLYLTSTSVTSGINVRGAVSLPSGVPITITMTYDGSSTAAGVLAYVNGQAFPLTTILDNLTTSIVSTETLKLGSFGQGSAAIPYTGQCSRLLVYARKLSAAEAASDFDDPDAIWTPPEYQGFPVHIQAGSARSRFFFGAA